jgi:hypothetical protein
MLMIAAVVSLGAAQKPAEGPHATKPILIIGQVLADVSSLTFGVGLGPQHTTFIFAIEQDGGMRVKPVKVSYVFFKSEGPPPDSFFDYSKRYELQVIRDTRCDERVDSLSYVKNADQSGNSMSPSYVLRFLEGAPKDVLEPDAILSCYILRPGKYKILGEEK